jgi:competence ComEA-like helix-hairpin-helix protein
MRLPFFKSSKAESTKTVLAPPCQPQRTQLAETQLIVSINDNAEQSRSAPIRDSDTHKGNGSSIPIPLNCIFAQLPAQLLAPAAREQNAHITIHLPADWVIPQLSTGKVSLPLAKLLPLLPQNILRKPLPVTNNQYAIVLPLEEIVTALPPGLLTHQDQTMLDIDTPEFDKLPKLFDDDDLEKIGANEETVAIIPPRNPAPAAFDKSSEAELAQPPVSATASPPSPTPVPTTPQPVVGNEILVSLRSLVAVMPDHVFACPRAELWRRVDLDSRVPLPRDVVLPQLQMARVRIPLAVAIQAMPQSILASPLPPITNETVPLALQEIVSQLPPQLFASTVAQSDEETLDFSENEIPMPFTEKTFAAAEPEVIAAALVEAGVSETPQSQPEHGSKVFEIPTDAFADEGLSVFAEKPAAPEPVVAEVGSQPEPTPELVAETPAPVAEVQKPIADIRPVEPVADISAEAVATVEIEPPAPATTEVQVAAEVPAPIEQPVSPTESVPEPIAVPAPVAEIPAEVSEVVHEAVPPAEQPVVAPSAVPTENKFLVNLNQCSAEELAKIDGVGPVLAQRIIEFRTTSGGFNSPKELRHVPGINRKTLRTLTGPAPRTLNRLLNVEHNEELTLQEIVRLTSQLKGVTGCILAMSDGVFLTGQLPPHLDQETISVFAPQLFKKVGRYMKELRVGQITRLSVFTDQQPLSIFRAGEIFLVVIHDSRYFSKALLRRCERISQEIARLCRQRAVV